ncbi:MAG: methionyl-tRNA formyltransferase [Phototrophicales bacterium]|nr:MAG: methionyl-tRNA formyltransferase [Phototrophicales bacterium]
MRVVFMGTPEFAIPSLQALIDAEDIEVVGVITQPDRPAGRGNQLRPSPVKQLAQRHNLPVFQPEKLRGEIVLEQLRTWQPDFHVVAAYGQILRQTVLDLPKYGSINVHASLLPRWRGAAPIQAAILHGDTESGITIMQMDAGLDTGPILSKRAIPISPQDTGQSLHDKLAAIAGPLLVETLRDIINGKITPQPQDETLATYAPRINKEDGRLDWTQSAIEIDRRVRAFFPWPGTFTNWNDQLLKIIAGHPVLETSLPAGMVKINHNQYSMLIGTGEGSYAPSILQLAGRKAMNTQDFINGFSEIDGATLGIN